MARGSTGGVGRGILIEIGGEQLLPAEVKRLCSGFPAGAFLDDAIGVGGPDVEGTGFVAGALEEDLEARTVRVFSSG